MKNIKTFGLLLLAVGLMNCKSADKKITNTTTDTTATPTKTGDVPDARYIVTEQSFGLVPLDATYETILRTFGKERVTEEEMYRAPDSDEKVMKTIINKNKIDEIIIQWDDSLFHKKIISIEAYRENHPYKTATGIRYGTTLAELVNINGAKISFSGFGWDFGGLLSDFHGGKLAYKDGKPNITYGVDIRVTQQYDEIMGDQMIDTDMPKAKKFLQNIIVNKIDLSPAF
ncbi:MAG: hypothetical protein RL115_646 [Bacteroidota bacterium]|jgi:hypothetical protein